MRNYVNQNNFTFNNKVYSEYKEQNNISGKLRQSRHNQNIFQNNGEFLEIRTQKKLREYNATATTTSNLPQNKTYDMIAESNCNCFVDSSLIEKTPSSNCLCPVPLKFKIKLNSFNEDNVACYKIFSVEECSTSKKNFENEIENVSDLKYNNSNSKKQNWTEEKNKLNLTSIINEGENSLNKTKLTSFTDCGKGTVTKNKNNHLQLQNYCANTEKEKSLSMYNNQEEKISVNNSNGFNFGKYSSNNQDLKIMRSAIFKKEIDVLCRIKNFLSDRQTFTNSISSTNIDHPDLINFVTFHKDKIFSFIESQKEINSLTISSIDKTLNATWPKALRLNYFGINYNLSKISEEIEYLNLSIIERFIRSETLSSLKLTTASIKKKSFNIGYSPGSRLSHLAKRRATFSSANLQIASQKTTNLINRRQILLNSIGNIKHKVPTSKRIVLVNKKISRTPNSIQKSYENHNKIHELFKDTSKRALFQSPAKKTPIIQPSKPIFKPEIAIRVEKSKRVLFSPDKLRTEIKNSIYFQTNKRKRSSDEEKIEQKEKQMRYESSSNKLNTDLTRSFKIKSQSFSIDNNVDKKYLFRSNSDSFCATQLSDSHKKKLLWAVSQALQQRKIGTNHPDFKKYVSILAKVIKRLFLEFYRNSHSTSETLLKLSKKYAYSVLNGLSSEEIYRTERNSFEKDKKWSNNGFDESVPNNLLSKESKQYFPFKSNTSIFLTEKDAKPYSQPCNISQYNLPLKFHDNYNSNVELNKCSLLCNRSSAKKKNLSNFETKENAHCILRKSGQKKFTGKDERNVSPHFEGFHKSNSQSFVEEYYFAKDVTRAKRQISFDD